MKVQSIDIIRAFTAFSVVQFIGFLSLAYPVLTNSMIVIILLLIALQLIEVVVRWSGAQSQVNHILSKAQVLSAIAPSLVILFALLVAFAVGIWIAL